LRAGLAAAGVAVWGWGVGRSSLVVGRSSFVVGRSSFVLACSPSPKHPHPPIFTQNIQE
jgi:hypothetical protein